MTLQEFTSRVNTVCRAATAQSQSLPLPSISSSLASPQTADLHAIAAYLSQEITVFSTLQHALGTLGAPPAMQTQWTHAIGSLQTSLTDLRAAQSAASAGDQKSYVTAFGSVVTDGSLIDQTFGAFGARDCTSTPSSPSPS